MYPPTKSLANSHLLKRNLSMSIPNIPTTQLILNDEIPADTRCKGLRIVRCQTDADAARNFSQNAYQFQHEPAEYTPIKATLCLKGSLDNDRSRIVVTVHPTLKQFVDIVQYDPSDPPIQHDYTRYEMDEAHKRTQSDFKGAKNKNRVDFRDYILEGVAGERIIYLPTISGWQSRTVFDKTIFVAFDEDNPAAMYGVVYLPKAPIMQSDGQTQTAALFATAKSKEATEHDALNRIQVTLEIELNVARDDAGQSFADRNGRGSKKNKNLVSALDISSALSQLRIDACRDTIFEGRLADGRTTGCGITATTNIVDLSTMEQMILNATTGGKKKPEHLKHFHVPVLLESAKELISMLEGVFGAEWPETTSDGQDTYRRLYVHGWAFALKAIALAYFRVKRYELDPINSAMASEQAGMTKEESFLAAIESATPEEPSGIDLAELKRRLEQIDWTRHRKHWTAITGFSEREGKAVVQTLKSGEQVVKAQSPNTAAVIGKVCDLILSDKWETLQSTDDTPVA